MKCYMSLFVTCRRVQKDAGRHGKDNSLFNGRYVGDIATDSSVYKERSRGTNTINDKDQINVK